MANTNSPFGLKWLGFNNGAAAPTFGLIKRKIAFNDTQVAGKGDLMRNLTTGYVSAVVAAGTAASACAGVFVGCSYLSTSQGKRVVSPYWPGADTAQDVDVLMIPLIGNAPQLFYAQATSTKFAFEDIGENVDIGFQAGVATGGSFKSGLTIAQSTLGTTVTLPFRVQGLYSAIASSGSPGTDDAAYNWVVVSFNSQAETGNA